MLTREKKRFIKVDILPLSEQINTMPTKMPMEES